MHGNTQPIHRVFNLYILIKSMLIFDNFAVLHLTARLHMAKENWVLCQHRNDEKTRKSYRTAGYRCSGSASNV